MFCSGAKLLHNTQILKHSKRIAHTFLGDHLILTIYIHECDMTASQLPCVQFTQ